MNPRHVRRNGAEFAAHLLGRVRLHVKGVEMRRTAAQKNQNCGASFPGSRVAGLPGFQDLPQRQRAAQGPNAQEFTTMDSMFHGSLIQSVIH